MCNHLQRCRRSDACNKERNSPVSKAEAGVIAAVPRVVREALVSWDHSADYPLPSFKDWTSAGGSSGFTKTYKLGGEHAFLADHVVDGRILMPVRPFLRLRLSLAIARWMPLMYNSVSPCFHACSWRVFPSMHLRASFYHRRETRI